MNPIIQSHVDQIHTLIEELGETLDARRTELTHQRAQHEDLLQRFWSQGRELAVLREGARRTEDLRVRNEALRERHETIRHSLERLLEQTKALASELLQ
jgi:hypothetical protein